MLLVQTVSVAFYGVCCAYCRGEHGSPDHLSLLFFFAKKKKRSKKRKALANTCLYGNVLHERQCYFRYMQHKSFGRYAAGEPCSPLQCTFCNYIKQCTKNINSPEGGTGGCCRRKASLFSPFYRGERLSGEHAAAESLVSLAVRMGLQTPIVAFSGTCHAGFLDVACADGFCCFYGVCRAIVSLEKRDFSRATLLFFFAKKKKRSKKRKALANTCLCGNVLHERQCYFHYAQQKFPGEHAAKEKSLCIQSQRSQRHMLPVALP